MTVHRLGQARVVQRFKGLTNTVVESVWSDGKLVSHCELVHDHARMCCMEVTEFSCIYFLSYSSVQLAWAGNAGLNTMGLDSGKMGQDFPMRGLVKCIWGFSAFNGIGFARARCLSQAEPYTKKKWS